MKTGTKNLLLAVAATAVLAVIMINSNVKHAAFVKKFDYETAKARGLPMLVEFGYKACPPCKMMKPVLESLDAEYSGDFAIGYIDTIENPDAEIQYGIKGTPTLIFFDKDGGELARLEGYTSKERILQKWKQLGVDISADN